MESLNLNRDVWSDETVCDLVGASLLFWHQNFDSDEAKQFCDRYSVVKLPYICIIDPRTQAVARRFNLPENDVQNKRGLMGFRETFQNNLIDFLDLKPDPYKTASMLSRTTSEGSLSSNVMTTSQPSPKKAASQTLSTVSIHNSAYVLDDSDVEMVRIVIDARSIESILFCCFSLLQYIM
jgi:hypothetical protein